LEIFLSLTGPNAEPTLNETCTWFDGEESNVLCMKVGWMPAAFASVDHGIACDPELKRWAHWLDFGATIHLKKKKKKASSFTSALNWGGTPCICYFLFAILLTD